jgi:hypothetical protein
MIDQLAILAALCVGIAFFAGMSAHQHWLDFVNWRWGFDGKGDRPADNINQSKDTRK